MNNDFVRRDEDIIGRFVKHEAVKSIFDKSYRDKPLEQRWNEYNRKKNLFDCRLW